MKRSLAFPDITKFKEKFEDCLLNYFGENYDERLFKKCAAIIIEIETYFKDGYVGGWSIWYCKMTWNDKTLENDADFEIFDLLLEIDIKNGADPTKIVQILCGYGAFEAVKVRNSLSHSKIKKYFHSFVTVLSIFFKIYQMNF